MKILTRRDYYKPFSYPEAYNFWEQQQNSFWVHHEINMDADIHDWKFNLNEDEKRIIGNILKSFVQSEVLIGDYWRRLGSIFEIPEISMMCAAFSAMETNHIAAYAYLNDALGIDNWQEFLHDPIVMERLSQLSSPPAYAVTDTFRLARSIAVFSAFGEGVALFSAFAILLSFAQRGLMRGLGEIIEMSIRDETLHSKGGMWLFNQMMTENRELHGLKKQVYEAGRLTVQIEDSFIDSVFNGATLPNCSPGSLKQFIRQRCNNQLRAVHLKPEYRIDKKVVDELKWFNAASSGDQHADFFASRITQYAKTTGWGEMWNE